MISKEQIAHDLTMVYLNNKYGVDVGGEFNINSFSNDDVVSSVYGSGEVWTNHIPGLDEIKYRSELTGKRKFFGLVKETRDVEDGFEVDEILVSMINDYYKVYKRIRSLMKE